MTSEAELKAVGTLRLHLSSTALSITTNSSSSSIMLQGKLYDTIDTSRSSWQVKSDGVVEVHLEKTRPRRPWPVLVADSPLGCFSGCISTVVGQESENHISRRKSRSPPRRRSSPSPSIPIGALPALDDSIIDIQSQIALAEYLSTQDPNSNLVLLHYLGAAVHGSVVAEARLNARLLPTVSSPPDSEANEASVFLPTWRDLTFTQGLTTLANFAPTTADKLFWLDLACQRGSTEAIHITADLLLRSVNQSRLYSLPQRREYLRLAVHWLGCAVEGLDQHAAIKLIALFGNTDASSLGFVSSSPLARKLLELARDIDEPLFNALQVCLPDTSLRGDTASNETAVSSWKVFDFGLDRLERAVELAGQKLRLRRPASPTAELGTPPKLIPTPNAQNLVVPSPEPVRARVRSPKSPRQPEERPTKKTDAAAVGGKDQSHLLYDLHLNSTNSCPKPQITPWSAAAALATLAGAATIALLAKRVWTSRRGK